MSGSLATWLQRIQGSHLWQDAGRPVKQSPVVQSGISVEYLRLLLNSLEDVLAGADTAVFVTKAILPLTVKKRSRLYDFIPAEFTGSPDYYIIHAWQGSFHDLLRQIINQARAHGSPLREIYVWLDIVAMDQHQSATAPPDLSHVRELVTVCSLGALIVMDTKLELLNRGWCLYEIWCFLYYKDLMNITVGISGDLNAEMLAHYLTATQTLDLTRAKTSRPQDLARIVSEVKASCGLKLFHKPLRDGLSLAVRSRMRFSPEIKEIAIYCLALLKMGEYGHLQQVLSDIPRLDEECNTLDDIKAIYSVYDTDGSGSLDEDEFIEVLRTAGFSTKEAQEIFLEVNIDGDDEVSLGEFEVWWINVHMNPGEVTLAPALLKKDLLKIKLVKMRDYAYDLELDDLSLLLYDQCVHDMKQGQLLGDQYPSELAPNPLRGEWEHITHLCVLKITNSSIKSAMKTMYDFFKLNEDQLVIAIKKIPNPRDMVDDPMYMAKVLPTYLQVMIYLISLEWGAKSQFLMRYLQDTIDQLKKPGAIAALGGLLNMIAADGGQINQRFTPVTPASYNYQTIIRHMVALKYGESTPVSKQLIAEAEKALGQFRAATKKGEEFNGNRDYIGKCGPSPSPVPTLVNPAADPKYFAVRREIPAEGHYRSLLADLGPDAHAYLEEIADKHDGGFEHSQEYLDELMDKKTDRKLLQGKSKKVFVQAPSFSNPDRTFEKARETISRSSLAPPNQLLQRKESGDEVQNTYSYSQMSAPWRDGSLPASVFADPECDSIPKSTDSFTGPLKTPSFGRYSPTDLFADAMPVSWDSSLSTQQPRAQASASSRRYSTSVVTAIALDHLATSAEGSVQQFTAGLKTILPSLSVQGSSSVVALMSPNNLFSSRISKRMVTLGPDSMATRGSSYSDLTQIESSKKEVSYSLAAPRRETYSSSNMVIPRNDASSKSPRRLPRRHSEKQISIPVNYRSSYTGFESLPYASSLRPTTVETASKAGRRPSLQVEVSSKSSHSIFDSPSTVSPHQAPYRATVTGVPSRFPSPVSRPTGSGLNLKVLCVNSEGQMRGTEVLPGCSKADAQLMPSQRPKSVSEEIPSPIMHENPVVHTNSTRRQRFSGVCMI